MPLSCSYSLLELPAINAKFENWYQSFKYLFSCGSNRTFIAISSGGTISFTVLSMLEGWKPELSVDWLNPFKVIFIGNIKIRIIIIVTIVKAIELVFDLINELDILLIYKISRACMKL